MRPRAEARDSEQEPMTGSSGKSQTGDRCGSRRCLQACTSMSLMQLGKQEVRKSGRERHGALSETAAQWTAVFSLQRCNTEPTHFTPDRQILRRA
ncbi:hypothetical protein NDU88_001155 [Pleurodeles waltl]|uniref:Uncharacterized protein n=1 Tax=Pleurodeles waltl TaxID=8319 RepID=A0AAV7URZ7_PLEWA|nr:hypothetical protein NDU88_001155 [Pleurodeles waltl]